LLYKLELTFLEPPVTLERLEEALREDYHILHYLGHGVFNPRRGQAALYLQDEAGHTQVVLDESLVYTVARQDTRPQLIFLAACQSAARLTADAFLGLAPKFIEVGVPAVVAMQDYVSLESARKLTGTFYHRLVRHGQVDKAINEARSTLVSAGRPDAAVPVLLTRLRSGSVWQGEADARGTVLGDKPHIFWSGLISNIKRGRCTPIIGPRARGRWLPNPAEIARGLAIEHRYPFADKDDPSGVTRYMASSLGEDFPRYELLEVLIEAFKERLPEGLKPNNDYKTLTELVQAVNWRDLTANDPNEIHRVLAHLDLPLYLTTNYDNFMTEALIAQGKKPTREICRWNQDLDWLPSRFDDDPNYEPSTEEPLVYHLFGNDTEIDSLVLTENNHMDFVVNVVSELERIHPYIRAALTNTSLMFLGYSLEDWGFRVIMRGLVAPLQRRRRLKHVGVQLEPGNVREEDMTAVHEFLKAYFQDDNINVFLGTVQQFVAELREHWEGEQ
ncbi:MAG: CHAT domain-containing protein, partial [Anaerolineae bacterium]|nr:CHAT domain-containing protein [Anaerolineae bacterium]